MLKKRHPHPLAALLALVTLGLAALGFSLRSQALGIALLAVAVPVAVAAWLALGAPVRRRDIR